MDWEQEVIALDILLAKALALCKGKPEDELTCAATRLVSEELLRAHHLQHTKRVSLQPNYSSIMQTALSQLQVAHNASPFRHAK